MELGSAGKTIELIAVLLAVSACGGEAFSLRTDGGSSGASGSTPAAEGGSGGRSPFMKMVDLGSGGLAGASGSQGTGMGGAVGAGGGMRDAAVIGQGGGAIDAGAGGDPGTCDSCDAGGCTKGETQCEGTCVDLSDDAANCGRCGHTCGGGTCSQGACQPWIVISEPLLGRIQIASDGDYLAWTNDATGVSVIPVSGMGNGAVQKVLNKSAAGALTIAEKKVVWFTNDANKKQTRLWTADETGGNLASSAPLATGGAAQAMGVTPGFGVAYLADAADRPPGLDAFSCTPVGSDAVCTKVQSVSGTNAGLTPVVATAFALTEGDSYMFYGGTAFSRLDLSTGDVTQLVSGFAAKNVYQAAIADQERVFWMEALKNPDFSTAFAIQKCLHTFVNPSTVVDGLVGSDLVGLMTADNAYIYFVTSNDVVVDPPTYIASIPKTNEYPGRPQVLYGTDGTIVAIISAGGALYWAEKNHTLPPLLTVYGQVFN